MKYLTILLVIASLSFFSCNKTFEGEEATVRWTGAYEVDGTGFFIILKDKEYKPVDESVIPIKYQNQYETAILIDYKLTKDKVEYATQIGMMEMDGIEILEIEDQ